MTMKRITMREFGLEPESDFELFETREAFFHYYSALRRQAIEQSVRSNELIPVSAILARLANEFGKSETFLHEVWTDMGNVLFSEMDANDDNLEITVVGAFEIDEDSDNDDVVDQFREFLARKIRERSEEEDLFAFLRGPSGVLKRDPD